MTNMKLDLHLLFQEIVALKGGRGKANLLIKCKTCGRENSLGKQCMINQFYMYMLLITDIVKDSILPYTVRISGINGK